MFFTLSTRIFLDFGKPFERMTMIDAVKKYAGVDFDEIADDAAAKAIAKELVTQLKNTLMK